MYKLAKLQRFDSAFSGLCLCHKFNQEVAKCSRIVSRTGDGHLYAILGAMLWFFDGRVGEDFFTSALGAFAIELPIYLILKNTIKRDRPKQLPVFIEPSDRYSLPSGHTAAAFIVAVMFAHFYPEYGSFALIWAMLIGMSRVFLGVHYVTDILAGMLLGIGSANLILEWGV